MIDKNSRVKVKVKMEMLMAPASLKRKKATEPKSSALIEKVPTQHETKVI